MASGCKVVQVNVSCSDATLQLTFSRAAQFAVGLVQYGGVEGDVVAQGLLGRLQYHDLLAFQLAVRGVRHDQITFDLPAQQARRKVLGGKVLTRQAISADRRAANEDRLTGGQQVSNVTDQRHLELLTGEVFRALDDLAKNSIGSISRVSAKPNPDFS